MIDFDDCGWSWYLADLGAAVSFIEDTPAGERIIADWLAGYFEVGSIPAEHLQLIPSFVMMRRIMLTAWIASHHDADAAIGRRGSSSPRTRPGWHSVISKTEPGCRTPSSARASERPGKDAHV